MKQFFAFALLALATLAQAQTATATVGTPFTYQLAPAPTSALAGGYLVTIDGAQTTGVAGLTYNNTTGILSGTPTAAGTHQITVQQATTTAGVFTTSTLALTINASGTTSPPVTPSALFCATDTNPACGAVLTWDAPGQPAPAVPATAATPAIPAQLAATGFLIFRGILGGAAPAQLTPTALPLTQLAYTDNTIAASTTYEYYVVSVASGGQQSTHTNTLTIAVAAAPSVPTPPTPPPPANLTGSVEN
jgi:hypothetical protein